MPRTRVALAVLGMVLALTAAQAFAEEKSEKEAKKPPSWGFGARYGTFGIPNQILDKYFVKHPSVSGSVFGGEIRYYGDGGPKGVFSLGLSVDSGNLASEGDWQSEEGDDITHLDADFKVLAATLTMYFDIAPSWVVHPYLGLGLGWSIVEANGTMREQGDFADFVIEHEGRLPAVHLPVGLAIQVWDHLTLRAEARIIDAFSLGGQIMVNF